MQFSYIKDLADSVSGKNADKVRDVVLTVPPFYTQHERQALEDAVEIAGLRLHAIVHDGTAVAVNYAMTRSFSEKKEYHIVYDAGATSITATVVSFVSTPAETKKGQNGTEITVSGVGFDRMAGGMELDRRMRELLVEDFSKKHRTANIRSDKRGMAKMWKEAGRVKTILSANTEASSSVSFSPLCLV
jgi:hypoxia up-regulated 1